MLEGVYIMNEQQIEEIILRIKQFFNLEEITFIKEVSDNQYFEAVEKDGTIRELRFQFGKLFVKNNDQWKITELFIGS